MRPNKNPRPIADSGGDDLRRRVLEEITKLQAALRKNPNRFTPEGLVALNEVLMTLNDIIPHTKPIPTLFGPSPIQEENPGSIALLLELLGEFKKIQEKDSPPSPENTP